MNGSRHRIRHSGESRNPGGRVAPTTPKHFQRPGLIFIPWCAGASRHERLVRKHVPNSDPGRMVPATSVGLVMPASVGIPSHSSFPRKRESRGGVWVANEPQTPPPVNTSIFIPWCAGSRHERLVRKHVPDSDPGWMVPATEFVIPAKAGIQGRNRRPPPIFIPQCAGGNRRGRFLWNLAPPRLATD